MRTLVVDDSKAMRGIVIRTLKQAGYDHVFEEASNGAEALTRIRADPPQLVFSDWNMPEMSGIELLRAVTSEGLDKKGVKFGFVTSEGSNEMRTMAREAGALFLIAKPFTPAGFLLALEPVLGGRTSPEPEAPQTSDASATGYRIRDAQILAETITSLARNKQISVKTHAPMATKDKMTVAAYRLEGTPVLGVCACDADLGAYLGALLSLIPLGPAKEAATAGSYPEALANNLREVFNVLAVMFEPVNGRHLRLAEIIPLGAAVAPDVMAALQTAPLRLDLSVDVPGYGAGRLAMRLVK